jgi:glycosyltransferase involved in cell wall biosynthesis
MKLSVIIPCYNAADTIGEQLEALSYQQWNETWEVIVADNNSTDHSIEVVKKYQAKIKNLYIVDASEKKGAAHARNKGVDHSKGELIAFCDADDVVEKGWLAGMGNALEKHDFVACSMDWGLLNNLSEYTVKRKPQIEGLNDFFVKGSFPHAGGGSLGIRKNVHYAVNGFDEDFIYLEDTDYCFRVQQKGYKLSFAPEALVHVRARSSYYKIFKQEMKWAEYGFYLFKKYQRHGLGDYPFRNNLRRLYYNFRNYHRLLKPYTRCSWIIRLAIDLGRIKGAVIYKLWGNKLIGQDKSEVSSREKTNLAENSPDQPEMSDTSSPLIL